jgi:hypothetical protein
MLKLKARNDFIEETRNKKNKTIGDLLSMAMMSD